MLRPTSLKGTQILSGKASAAEFCSFTAHGLTKFAEKFLAFDAQNGDKWLGQLEKRTGLHSPNIGNKCR